MPFRAITLQLDDINEVAHLARLAEDAGFSLAWGIDTPRSNVFVHLAAMAANTKKIQLGSGIARPASQMKELVHLIRQVWALNGEGNLDFQGKFYQLNARGFTLTKALRQD